jgi:SAM-dependent methyltransferase
VVLYNVLEHLPDPRTALRAIRDLLRPRGILIVCVPNFDSWQARATTAAWFHLDVPRHLHHFTPTGLKALLTDARLVPGRERNVSLALDVFGWVQSLQNLVLHEPNALHSLLLGSSSRKAPSRLHALSVLLLSGVLAGPTAAIAVGSWLARKGALMEVWARKGA